MALALLLASAIVLMVLPTAHATDNAALWRAIRSGEAFAILRHELAPGIGDPNNFQIGNCTTQRILSDTGRKQATTTGERFRENGINRADVYSSQWCRCRETAKLLGLGNVLELPALNSFYENYEKRTPHTQQLKEWLDARNSSAPLVLVSHQVNIRALTGEPTRSGEIVVAQILPDGKIVVLGKLYRGQISGR